MLPIAVLAIAPAHAVDEALQIDLPKITGEDVVELEADELVYRHDRRRAEATGEARLFVRDVMMSAERMVLDLEGGFAEVIGDVRIDHGHRRLLASSLHLEIDGEHALAKDPQLEITDPRTQRLVLQIVAARLERKGPDLFLAERLSFTTCDCGERKRPSWSLSARSARIEPDRGALLFWTAFRILDVPVLPLPVFYLPLGERRSGLLTPRFGLSGQNGPSFFLPVYLTLGRSWDLTYSPGWYAGNDTWESTSPSRPGVRGPEQSLELRWAPARRTRGALELTHLFDLHRDDPDPEAEVRGSRGSLRLGHTSRFDDGGFGEAGHGAHASVNLLSDAALLGDLEPSLEQAQRGYLRSTARAHLTPAAGTTVEMGGRWLQDVRQRILREDGELQRSTPFFGRDAPDTAQLLPLFHASVVPSTLTQRGLGGRADLRLASWLRPAARDERPKSTVHLRGSTELSQRLAIGEFLGGRASLSVAGDTWRDAGKDALSARAYPKLETGFHTAFERRFSSVLHRARPALTWRLIPVVLGEAHSSELDVFERALSDEGLHQISMSLRNDFWSRGNRSLTAALEQGFDIEGRRPSDLDFSLSLSRIGPARSIDVMGGWSWEEGRPSWMLGSFRLAGARGSWLRARWMWVEPHGGTRMTAGLEELFHAGALPPPPLETEEARIHEAVLGIALPRMRGLGLRYDISLEMVDDPRPPQHRLRASYVSECRCWSGAVVATWPPGRAVPEITLFVELAGLGSAGTG